MFLWFCPSFFGFPRKTKVNKRNCGHFGIYDGHGGRLAAEFAKKHLHLNVLSSGLPRELMDVKVAKKAILDVLPSNKWRATNKTKD
ncbi:hypothetical protein YC2023_070435 [Brassica napus]